MSLRIATFNVENLLSRKRFGPLSRPDAAAAMALFGFEAGERDMAERALSVTLEDDKRQLTALAIAEAKADILCLQEVDNLAVLEAFFANYVHRIAEHRYGHFRLVRGNDERGIDVGVMARNGYKIGWMRSHVDDQGPGGGRVFSRDCPEYSVWTPSGQVVWVLINHLKSKGYGAKEASDGRRKAQAEAVRAIYDRLVGEGAKLIAVIGDLNDTPESEALSPLVRDGVLKDISTHPSFVTDGHLGTYGRASARDKLDYILLSPDLFPRMTAGGYWRKGVWGPNKTPAWEIYPEMKSSYDAASDHAAVWCDLSV